MKKLRRRISVGGVLSEPGPPVRPLKEKEFGPFGVLSTSNPGAEVPRVVAPGVAPNVSVRGADDVDMGDEVAQRSVSDAESVGSDELRERRRRNSPSDPTSREIEDHVLTGHASFRSWCAACFQGRGRRVNVSTTRWGRHLKPSDIPRSQGPQALACCVRSD